MEKELQDICSSILQLLDDHLIPTASTGESKVFYLKMKVGAGADAGGPAAQGVGRPLGRGWQSSSRSGAWRRRGGRACMAGSMEDSAVPAR